MLKDFTHWLSIRWSPYGIFPQKETLAIIIRSQIFKCPLHIASYALRIGVSVMEL